MAKKYHKIEGIYKRNNETKKVVEGKFKNPVVEQLRDTSWICTEKVDGTNVRVIWDGHRVSFAGRTDKAQFHPGLTKRLEDMFNGDEMEDLFEERFGENTAIIFGEGYGPKIQSGGKYRDDIGFIGFDLMVNDKYRTYGELEEVSKYLNFDIVPYYIVDDIGEAVYDIKKDMKSSVAHTSVVREGIVCKPYPCDLYDLDGNRVVVKIKTKDIKNMESE